MAFSTPATVTAGSVLTASYLNTYVRDNIAWLATDSPACRAYNNADVTIPTSATTPVTLNSERYDNAAVHSTGSNTSRFTVPSGSAGKYMFLGNVTHAANATGIRTCGALLNGTTALSVNSSAPTATAVFGTQLSFCTVYALSVADYVEMTTFQSSGGNLASSSVLNATPEASLIWLRT